MKKFLLSCTLMFAAVSSWAAVGDDLTAKYLKNADFSQDTPVTGRICTYDYDMAGGVYSMFGQQTVAGWTALNPSDNVKMMENSGSPAREDGANARAAGIFAVGAVDAEGNYVAELGGTYYAPEVNSAEKTEGNVLGLIAVWGATVQYTQDVTLPAGCYTITIPTYNAAGTGTVSTNLFGFIAEDGKAYTCSNLSWGEVAVWEEQTVTFILEKETKGVISLGFSGPGGSGSMPHLFIDYIKIQEADPAPLIQEQVDALKEELLPLLEAGDELGVNTKDGWAVYNNDNATVEDVQKAIDNQKEINERGMTDFTDYFLNNAHFTIGDPLDNGVCTYAKDTTVNATPYFGMQPIPYWTASSPGTDAKASGLFAVGSGENAWLGAKNQGYVAPETKANGATEGNVFGFVGCWSASASYTQHVTLPAGSYTINIPTYNSKGGTSAIAKNLCGFIADDGTEYLAETKTFPVNKWTNEVIKFTLDYDTPGVISIGYEATNSGSGAMPHLFIDEFTLKFNGIIDESPSLIALRGAVTSAEEYEAFYEASIKARLDEAVSAGYELVRSNSKDDEANTAAATEINNLMVEAKASAATYEKFNNFIFGKLTTTIENYAEGDLSDFSVSLQELRDEYSEAYENGSYTADQIAEIINGFQGKVVEAVKAALETAAVDGAEHNLDISVLFNNIDYANSTVEGWQNETGTSAFLSRVQTAEVWNQSSFNVYQTLAEMPAGAYEISTNGFYRTAANTANYAQWESQEVNGKAYLYAGGNKVLMHNVAEYAAAQDNNHTAEVGDGLFVPNSNANANYIFYTDKDAVNTVATALVEAGDLTIGVKAENLEGNAWVVWGAFSVIYKGTSEEMTLAALNGEIESLIEQAKSMSEDGIVESVEQAFNGLEDAISAGEDAIDKESVETKTEAIKALKVALQYASETTPLMEKLMDVFSMYSSLLGDTEVESDDDTLANLLDEEIADPENGAPSNEKIAEWIEQIPVAWVKFVCGQSQMSKASEKNPVDVSPVILNAGFEGVLGDHSGAEYWSVTKDGGNEGYEYGIYEFFNNNSFDINQTITNLTPGYYQVKVQSFYRAGDNSVNLTSFVETPDSINHAVLYANDGAVNVKNVLDLTAVEDSGYEPGMAFDMDGEVTVSYNGNEEFYIPNNRNSLQAYFEAGCYWNEVCCQVAEDGVLKLGIKKDARISNDWCPYDNFQLYYLGTAAPTALESITVSQVNASVYDLQGRKVSKAQKGLYIMNGKVVLVK